MKTMPREPHQINEILLKREKDLVRLRNFERLRALRLRRLDYHNYVGSDRWGLFVPPKMLQRETRCRRKERKRGVYEKKETHRMREDKARGIIYHGRLPRGREKEERRDQ